MSLVHGAITALLTPFREGEINRAVYESDVERQIGNGIDGLVACGTTAETPTLTSAERDWLIRSCIVTAGQRVPVFVGTGTNATATTIEATCAAKKLGADAALVVAPYYNRPSQEGLYRHFEAVAASCDLPIVLYNVPARTGVDLLPETVSRLSRLDGIVGIKEATGDRNRIALLRRVTQPGFTIYSGDDATTLDAISAGANGSISVISNAFPAEWSELCRLAMNGRDGPASILNATLRPLRSALALESNPGPIKYLMSLVCRSHSHELRLPLVPIEMTTAKRIRNALDDMLEQWASEDSGEPHAVYSGSSSAAGNILRLR